MSGMIYDPIRKMEVAAEPEELVRQALIKRMINDLGFPLSLLAVEKALIQVPHLAGRTGIPDRRVDLLCFAKGIHPDHNLYPLLLVECKATPLTDAVIQQVTGYNTYVGAPYVAVVNQKEIRMGSWDRITNAYSFIDWLPSYEHLKSSL